MTYSENSTITNDDVKLEPVDAIVNVFISDDNLKASVKILPPENGGQSPNIQSLRAALEEKGVVYGIDVMKLLSICKDPKYDEEIIVAQGVEPVDGVDGSYEVNFDTTRDLKPKEREDGTVDFHDLGIVENVEKGQIICNLTPPTEGKDGISVTGKKILARDGKPVIHLCGENVELNKDETAIIAKVSGRAEYTYGKINVYEILVIKGNVDTSTGNIKFAGNVIIMGRVRSGYLVEAAGNIDVRGGVNSATLISGGNMILECGVTGSKLESQGDIHSRFIESTEVYARGDIKTDYIMNSYIKCGKTLQTTGRISKIVGGTYLVGGNIEANIIGSTAEVKTYLELGTDPLMIERRGELEKEIPSWEEKIKGLKSLISILEPLETANQLRLDRKRMLENARYSYRHISKALEEGKKELEKINEVINSRELGRIICRETIYPGTMVKIGLDQIKINRPLTGRTFYYSEKGIGVRG